MKQNYVNTKNILKFIICSAIGIAMFLLPVPSGDSFTTLLDFVKISSAICSAAHCPTF